MRKAMTACRALTGPDCHDLHDTIEIALTEALNNVVEHARPQQDIEIRLSAPDSGLVVCITDRGAAYPDLTIPRPDHHDLSGPVDDLPEGGFGWRLILDLASAVHYHRNRGENHLWLSFESPPHAART